MVQTSKTAVCVAYYAWWITAVQQSNATRKAMQQRKHLWTNWLILSKSGISQSSVTSAILRLLLSSVLLLTLSASIALITSRRRPLQHPVQCLVWPTISRLLRKYSNYATLKLASSHKHAAAAVAPVFTKKLHFFLAHFCVSLLLCLLRPPRKFSLFRLITSLICLFRSFAMLLLRNPVKNLA